MINMPTRFPDDASAMARALELAQCGLGSVEPNPPVGAVIVDAAGELLGEGYHERFGGPHAEIHALEQAGDRAEGGTIFVTLEPCCHHGKTPPCTEAILAAGLKRVVVGTTDPAPHASGRGITELREAGLEVVVGVLEVAARNLIAPFASLMTKHRPYLHAKWAMTLDGKIASREGHSQWISGAASRRIVHQLRGRMDAIVVGAATARIDDPLLTARPQGPRTATRIIVDPQATLPLTSRLIQTLEQAPVMIVAGESAEMSKVSRLEQAGAEVLRLPETAGGHVGLEELLKELGRRQFTNILIEGGGQLLGSFFDANLIDEVHVFIAPKLVGGKASPSPIQGVGLPKIPDRSQFASLEIQTIEDDVYIRGRVSTLDLENQQALAETGKPLGTDQTPL